MSKKELWQVGWTGGQTEGDLTKETVREILNAEIKTYGMLDPRDTLVDQEADETIANVIDLKFMTDPSDPSTTLTVYLTTTHVKIRGGVSPIDVALDIVIDSDSEMIIIEGYSIYVSAIVSGVPYGIFSLIYTGEGDKFLAPSGLSAHAASSELTGGTNEWIMVDPVGIVPVLSHLEMSGTYIADAKTMLDADSNSAVVIGTYANRSYTTQGNDDFPVAASIGIEIAVQFEFQNGELSPISNKKSVSYVIEREDDEWVRSLSIGINLAVSRNISNVVKRINVFRRVIELDGTHYGSANDLGLLYSANLMSDDIEDEVVSSTGSAALERVDVGDDAVPFGDTHFGEFTGGINWVRPTYQYRTLDSGVLDETTGWLQYDTNAMFYWPRSLIFDGDLNIKLVYSSSTDDWYQMEYTDSQGVFTWPGKAGSYVSVFQNNHVLDGDTYGAFAEVDVSTKIVFPFQSIIVGGANDVKGYGPDICPYMINNDSAPNYTAHKAGSGALYEGTVTGVSDLEALVCYVDIGDARLVTVDDLVGFSQNEESIVKPRHIGVSSGRMLMLNVIQDDENKPARLCYSEFRKYSAVAKSNYVDYAPRDDGVGVGIAEFKSRILVLHSTSAYIMDISGGSGMAWRELGAYNEINALGRNAIVESPFGVFFGGQDFAYLFDGQKIVNIIERPQSRMTRKYKEMVATGDIFFAWRSDLRQLWIIGLAEDDGNGTFREVLVFDADSGAWHYHKLNEIEDTTTTPHEIIAISNQVGDEIVFTKEGTDNIKQFKLEAGGLTKPFNWGIDTGPINMGSSEFQKKLKRIYIDTLGYSDADGNPTYGSLSLDVGGYEQSYAPPIFHHVERVSSSYKSYYLNFTLYAKDLGDGSWNGTIESLGLSYKPKKLK